MLGEPNSSLSVACTQAVHADLPMSCQATMDNLSTIIGFNCRGIMSRLVAIWDVWAVYKLDHIAAHAVV